MTVPTDVTRILDTLTPQHPRLLVTSRAFDRLRDMRKDDPLIEARYVSLRQHADELLDAPLGEYRIPDGLRLVPCNRGMLDSVMTLGLAWRAEGNEKYAQRVWRDLQAVCEFPDWNPQHFLDTAEMTAAVAIGYDWLFDHWTKDQRAMLREAIIRHGLLPAKQVYDAGEWWAKSAYNWNQVCNGGITMGALAIAEEQHDLAAEIVQRAVESLPLALASYGPDGAWGEGPGYWNYATMYTTMVLSSLTCSLGTDFGLSEIPGVRQCGDMPIYFTAPSGMTFNFADARERTSDGASLFWLAGRFDSPRFAKHRIHLLEQGRPAGVLDLLWYEPKWAAPTQATLPTARYFRGTEVVSMRSAWNDPQATFVGFKSGCNAVNHANLDLGTFILEANGERWAVDLGGDNYNLPEYFGKLRWTYYRMRAEGHNTLVINADARPDQKVDAATTIRDFQITSSGSSAAIDLTAAYSEHDAEHVRRTLTLQDKAVMIRDEVRLKNPGEIRWFWHTRAEVAISSDGSTATLMRGGKQLTLRLQSPAGARFTLMDAVPLATSPNPSGQNPNNGSVIVNGVLSQQVAMGTTPRFGPADPTQAVRKLVIHLTRTAQATIIVHAQP